MKRVSDEVVASLKFIQKDVKRMRRARRADVSKQALALHAAKCAKSPSVKTLEDALVASFEVEDESEMYLFMSAVSNVLSGADPRPIAFMDTNFHKHFDYNVIHVDRDITTNELNFAEEDVNKQWSILKRYFDVTPAVVEYKMEWGLWNEDEPAEEECWRPTSEAPFFLYDRKKFEDIFHSFLRSFDKEANVGCEVADHNFIVHPRHANRATMTYHLVILSVKETPNPAATVKPE
jgi:hypothetical protein